MASGIGLGIQARARVGGIGLGIQARARNTG